MVRFVLVTLRAGYPENLSALRRVNNSTYLLGEKTLIPEPVPVSDSQEVTHHNSGRKTIYIYSYETNSKYDHRVT